MEISAEEEAIREFGFTDTSSGNRKGKSFCKNCGCTLWTIPGAAKGVYHLVRTSILDEGQVATLRTYSTRPTADLKQS